MAKPKSRRGTGSVYQRGQVWWIKFYDQGRAFYESSGSKDQQDAERLLKRRQGEVVTGRFGGLAPERIRMVDLFEDVLADHKRYRRATTKDVATRIRMHLKPAIGDVRAAQLGTRHVERYIDQRREEGAAEATINRELAIIRRAFSLGFKSDPPRVLRQIHVPHLKEQNARQGFLEFADYIRLRNELPKEYRPVLVVGYHTGIRIGELRKIQWDQVDFAAGEIRLQETQTKNDRPRTVPIYGEMREWLLWAKEERDQSWPDCPWVFQRHRRQIGDFRKAWKSACERAGLSCLLFHDLRRSAVRNMERAGIPRNVAKAISGHRTDSVYQRYDIVSRRDLASAGDRMESYFLEQSEQVPAPSEALERVQ